MPLSLKARLCVCVFLFFPAAGLFCGYLISYTAASGLRLDFDIFRSGFKTLVAIHCGGCDLCGLLSDRKVPGLLCGFTVN